MFGRNSRRFRRPGGVLRRICAGISAAALMLGTWGTGTQLTGMTAYAAKAESTAARAKYTTLKGAGKDKVTLMIYMCGTDLESQSGMATADLNEMLYAGVDNDNLNIFVQTGGCRKWRNSVMQSKTVERWLVTEKGLGKIAQLNSQPMTDEDTLVDFVNYCKAAAPADRYMLIFWDHGGGSVTGYGYDELYPNDSMTISEISKALKSTGIKYDFIGFDACLMATLETAIALEPYADYMLASEESEPGTGWYYTNWLRVLADNTSVKTEKLGQIIADDFTEASKKSSYSGTTLSMVDLSELNSSVVSALAGFGEGLTTQLKSEDYQSVATARCGTREFAQSSRIDQIDLVDFCNRLGTDEAAQLAEAIQSAVKVNVVNNISNAYGLSIYFPNSSLKSMNSMIQLYEDIGMDESWTEGVRTYATLESSGQIAATATSGLGTGSGSLIDILLGGGYGSSSYSGSSASSASSGSAYSSSGSVSLTDILSALGSMSSGTSSASSSQSYSNSGYGSILESLLGSGSYGSYGGYGGSGYSQSSQSSSSSSSSGYWDLLGSLLGGSTASQQQTQTASQSSGGFFESLLQGALGGSYADTGYTTTSGQSYGGSSYSSIFGGSNTSVTSDLISLAASLLSSRATLADETLTLTDKDGVNVLYLDEDRWEQVTDVELQVFLKDEGGYLDLGLDNVAEYDDDGDLIDSWDGTWLTLQGQPVAIYPVSDEDPDGDGLYVTTKYIPVLLNGERYNLIAQFDEASGEDTILGAQSVLENGVQGKGLRDLEAGDEIQPVCDYYTNDGQFKDQYTLGDVITVPEDETLELLNLSLTSEDGSFLYTYRLTDIYQANYWLPVTAA